MPTSAAVEITVQSMLTMVSEHAKLKCPSGGNYAWEAGCLHSIIRDIAMNHPEILPTVERDLAWHTKQVLVLVGSDAVAAPKIVAVGVRPYPE